MDASMEPSQSALVVFGPDHIDTSRAEMLVQRLNDKIKEKRFKLQKLIGINEEKKKRTETMKNEKLQLTTKLANIEQENSIREQQLQSEQVRIKELQFNIQMLDDHNISIKRDRINEERKYEQEKRTLISKFERIKQQWTDIFKPQYEQSKVYQFLKQGDAAYNTLVEQKDKLLNNQRLAYQAYATRRREFCDERKLQVSILSLAKYFLSRRDQQIKIEQMKGQLLDLENKEKQLTQSKLDKMKAWESVYTQPMKRDLMDFCLQANIDQALTLSFNQLQQDIWSQPMTPTILTPQTEQVHLIPEEHAITLSVPKLTTSTITVVPNAVLSTPNAYSRPTAPSILHLTTAIDDDDEALFSASRRKIPTIQMEQMTINDFPPSTQAFVVTTTATTSNMEMNREILSRSETDHPHTQAFTTAPTTTSTSVESYSGRDLVTPTFIVNASESTDIAANKSHSTVTFQLAQPRIQDRPVAATISSIQPQVTSNDVQQMLLTFSPDPSSSVHEEQPPQPMEDDSAQIHQEQQRPNFPMPSSIESTASTEDGYAGFNYNFGFNGNTADNPAGGERGFTSPINFENWTTLGSPVTPGSNEQFSAFLQRTNSGEIGGDTSFSFASFNYGELNSGEASADGAFGSFFFGNGGSPVHKEQASDGKST